MAAPSIQRQDSLDPAQLHAAGEIRMPVKTTVPGAPMQAAGG